MIKIKEEILVCSAVSNKDIVKTFQTQEYVCVKTPSASRMKDVHVMILTVDSKTVKDQGMDASFALIADVIKTRPYNKSTSNWKKSASDRDWTCSILVKNPRIVPMSELSKESNIFDKNARVAGGIGYCACK
jgi:hypothetical protein